MANPQLLQPQELEVFYIIPTIRKYLTLNLKQRGLNQKTIAHLLGIRESTVSQYINDKRAAKISFSDETQSFVKDASQRIETQTDMIREVQTILKHIRTIGELCSIHKQLSCVPVGCEPHATGCIDPSKDEPGCQRK